MTEDDINRHSVAKTRLHYTVCSEKQRNNFKRSLKESSHPQWSALSMHLSSSNYTTLHTYLMKVTKLVHIPISRIFAHTYQRRRNYKHKQRREVDVSIASLPRAKFHSKDYTLLARRETIIRRIFSKSTQFSRQSQLIHNWRLRPRCNRRQLINSCSVGARLFCTVVEVCKAVGIPVGKSHENC